MNTQTKKKQSFRLYSLQNSFTSPTKVTVLDNGTCLNVKRASTKLATGLVMKLHTSRVLIEASSFPLDGVVSCIRSSDESRKKVRGAVKGVENGP